MIRPMLPEDIDAIMDIWLRASIASHNFIAASYWQQRASFVRNIYLPHCLTFVFVDDADHNVVAFAALFKDCLAGLFVDPAQQRRGIGSRLLHLAQRICPHLHVCVYAENQSALAFYTVHGLHEQQCRIDEETGHKELVLAFSTTKIKR